MALRLQAILSLLLRAVFLLSVMADVHAKSAPLALPNVTLPANITLPPSISSTMYNTIASQLANITIPKSALNMSLPGLVVPGASNASVSGLIGLAGILSSNQTQSFIGRLGTQVVPLVLACHSNQTTQMQTCFKTWEAVFNKSYPNATEEAYRYTVFVNNTTPIINQDAAILSYLGKSSNATQIAELFLAGELPVNVTQIINSTTLQGFSAYNDRTAAELKARVSSLLNDTASLNTTAVNITEASATLGGRRLLSTPPSGSNGQGANWIPYAAPIKDQAGCGYCYVFATTGLLEIIANMAANQIEYEFSEQDIIDCSEASCDTGGNAAIGSWAPYNSGVVSEDNDPYLEDDGDPSLCKKGTKVFTNLMTCKYSWSVWKQILNYQPTYFAVYSDCDAFMNYQGNGIYTTNCQGTADHLIAAVGWNTTTDSKGNVIEYMYVRNSWGPDNWGYEGYGAFAMTRNGKELNLNGVNGGLGGVTYHQKSGVSPTSLSGASCSVVNLGTSRPPGS